MNIKEERMIVTHLLSSQDVFTRCNSILDPAFFHPKLKGVVSFIKEYYNKYNDIVDPSILNSKFDVDGEPFTTKTVTKGEYKFACDSIELFCKQRAVRNAVTESMPEVDKGNLSVLYEAIMKATSISLATDLGLDFYSDPEAAFELLKKQAKPYTTGIEDLDKRLGGGLFRKQLTLFSANSGGGKSVMLTNLAVNYSLQGLDVLYISLELPEDQIFLRAASILTNYAIKDWRDNIAKFVSNIIQTRNNGVGSLRIKRLIGRHTTNDIRSYIKQYELEHGKVPDVLLVDYLDKMSPNSGKKQLSVSEQDKDKTEELAELILEYNMIGASASQQTRDAIGEAAPTQAVIAGGITKVNTVDNYISIFMSDNMKMKGELLIFFLKTRYSDGVGEQAMLKYSPSSLKITDMGGPMKLVASLSDRKKHIKHLIDSGMVSEDNDERITHNPLVAELLDIDIGTDNTLELKNEQKPQEVVKRPQMTSFMQNLMGDDLEEYVTIDK